MSNIYIQEPPTEGKVLLVTSAGDLDIELWSKEAPKACRNFVQLCLEGYYDGTLFHRVVPGFIAQGGDPTGTGSGGDSIYGKPFRDEFHTRLRFTRRGLVAMANGGPNDNGSQFFFTLGPCPELQNKHTIFAKVAGNTIYNLPRFEEGDIGKDERPEFPHKIVSSQVLKNPFSDIVPRESTKIENEVPKNERKRKRGTKNFKLLSFGDEAEEDEEEVVEAIMKMPNKSNSAHDIAMDPTLSSLVDQTKEREEELQSVREKLRDRKSSNEETEKERGAEVAESDAANELNGDQKLQRRSEIKAEIRKLKRELQGKASDDTKHTDADAEDDKSKGNPILEKYYNDRAKYEENQKQLPKKGVSRESQTLALLQRFADKVKRVNHKETEGTSDAEDEEPDNEMEDINDNEDDSWLTHRLVFDENLPVLAKDASTRDDHWYDITDPRNAINKRRREEKPKEKVNLN